MSRRYFACPLLLLLASCSHHEAGTEEESVRAVALESLSSCTELDAQVRQAAHQRVDDAFDAVLEQIDNDDGEYCANYAMGESDSASDGGGAVTTAPTSVSETNNQVAGVDEADLVKTDGQYLYLAQAEELRIVDAWPANESREAATLALGGTAKKLFVAEDRALVYVSMPRDEEQAAYMVSGSGDCSYGYGCDFSGDGSATRVLIVDVSDRAAPTILRTLDFAGSLIAARRIGNTVHTVVSIAELTVPGLELPSPWEYGCAEDLTATEKFSARSELAAARKKQHALVDQASLDIGVLAREGDRVLGAMGCTDFYRETSPDGSGITSVVSLDLQSDDDPVFANVLSRAGAVYASGSSLYMAVPHQRDMVDYWYHEAPGDEASTVHQFAIGKAPTDTAYLASGVVPGRVLNQFSMDEYQGVLRIATTNGYVPNPDVESTLSILSRDGHQLQVIGQVEHIAPTEDIRSVRFDGERGYVVTFKKTDPLFVLDLSEPKAPKLVGELKIPGFSTYMHRLDENHLLALGYEADDQGDFAYFNGIQLQLFDVTNPTQPELLHKKVYGTRGSSSSALTDHLGFTFLADRNLLTLPMSICDGGGNGGYGTLSFSGVVALEVSLEQGFTELGRLSEPYPPNDGTFYQGAECSDWWTDSNSVVDRTVVADQYLYAISENRVRIQDLGALGTDVAVVDF